MFSISSSTSSYLESRARSSNESCCYILSLTLSSCLFWLNPYPWPLYFGMLYPLVSGRSSMSSSISSSLIGMASLVWLCLRLWWILFAYDIFPPLLDTVYGFNWSLFLWCLSCLKELSAKDLEYDRELLSPEPIVWTISDFVAVRPRPLSSSVFDPVSSNSSSI